METSRKADHARPMAQAILRYISQSAWLSLEFSVVTTCITESQRNWVTTGFDIYEQTPLMSPSGVLGSFSGASVWTSSSIVPSGSLKHTKRELPAPGGESRIGSEKKLHAVRSERFHIGIQVFCHVCKLPREQISRRLQYSNASR